MRATFKYLICMVFILLFTGSLWAKDRHTVTVLPFTLNSSENIEYVKQGIQDMLITRISASNKINVTAKEVVAEELRKTNAKQISLNDVYSLGKKLKSDYVVWGSITKIGSSISVDGKLVDISSAKSDVGFFTQSPNMDEVIPKVNDFSQRIVQHIIGGTPQAAAPTAAPAATTTPTVAPGISREAMIIAGMKAGKRGTLTSVINADYINSPYDPFKHKGFWMSQQFPTEFKGMDVGDVNGDGKNEVVVIDDRNIYIYQKLDHEFRVLQKITGKRYEKYLSVDVADIKKTGVKQIYVTSLIDADLVSFVVEYKDGKYVTTNSNLKWFLRVLDTPSGIPLLLGQSYGFDEIFNTAIYEIVWRNGKFVEGPKMKIPLGLSIYGLAIDNFGTGGGDDRLIALDELDYLCIFRQTNKPLNQIFTFGFRNDDLIWRSDEVFGGSNNYFENVSDKKRYEEESSRKSAYVNLRILTHDFNKDGKKELIIVKNSSATGRIFKNIKMFTSSEIYNLEWDGLGMAENWRTKKINGYVADYVFKDIDNDGKPELVLALVLSVGSSVREKSVVVFYKLDGVNQ
ncbi:MAG: FG-GAP-like repeat-containing protein [Smithellaceae bacterium]